MHCWQIFFALFCPVFKAPDPALGVKERLEQVHATLLAMIAVLIEVVDLVFLRIKRISGPSICFIGQVKFLYQINHPPRPGVHTFLHRFILQLFTAACSD